MEPHIVDRTRNAGWIEVICGSMFSGKTEELIRRLRRARIARQHVTAFKPALDTRYGSEEVVSHDQNAIATTPVHAAGQILLLCDDADVVGIDEAQFFGTALVDVCGELARNGTRVVVAGLDQDYRGQPFDPIPQLMAVAEHVTKLHAVCMRCGAAANHSQRIVAGEDRVLVGADEAYEPRCRRCFSPPQDAPSRPASASLPDQAVPEAVEAPDAAQAPTNGRPEASEDDSPSRPEPPADDAPASASASREKRQL
jgi:thymidine kinase